MSTLGNRYECISCEIKFYDLGKAEAICPACGTNQADSVEAADESKAPKKKKKAAKKKAAKKKDAKKKDAGS